MKKLVFLTLFLFSSLSQADSTNVKFINGWIKQLPPVIPMRAGYMQISNRSDQSHEIVAIHSEAFEKVEMHETTMADGMMKMIQQYSIVIPAKGLVELKPGGKHLMLIAPKQAMQIGDMIDLTVSFSDETSRQIQLEVRK